MLALRRTREWIPTLALALGLLAPLTLTTACDGKDGLTEVEAPVAGVMLGYELRPGTSFTGKIEHLESTYNIQAIDQKVNRTARFDVDLVVMHIEDNGNARVVATVKNLDLRWGIPSGIPISMTDLINWAKQKIDGADIPFSVTPQGEVVDVPPAPGGLHEMEKQLLEAVIEGLTASFAPVPGAAVKAGESWSDEQSKGREGRLGKYWKETRASTLSGVYEKEGVNGLVARVKTEIERNETTTTKDSQKEIKVRSTQDLLFAVDGKHLVQLKSKRDRTDGGWQSSIKFSATWQPAADVAVPAGPAAEPTPENGAAGGETQSISDPCHFDYVGPKECEDSCSPNYMGDEPCDESATAEGDAPAEDGDAAESAPAAEDAESAANSP